MLKDKIRNLDLPKLEYKNLMNQTPFTSFLEESDSVDCRNAIGYLVRNNFQESAKLNDADYDKKVEV